jgi:hypothetical protein
MKPTLLALVIFASLAAHGQSIYSPSRTLQIQLTVTQAGELRYQLFHKGKEVIKPSRLGFELLNIAPLTSGFSTTRIDSSASDTSWEPVWGEVKTIHNNYKELAATVSHRETGITIVVRFRLFDDGVGFRYEFPRQPGLNHFVVTDEVTEFNLTGDHKTFWIPGDYDTNEYGYYTTKLSETEPEKGRAADVISAQWMVPGTIQTPLMMKSAEGLYINVHEAALINYPAMLVAVDGKTFSLTSHLVPDAVGNKAYLQTPFQTPWRTVLVSDKATELLASKTILNLNEPTALTDVSWIKPMKYVGIWWEMHANVGTWNYADTTNLVLNGTQWSMLKANRKHSANTANVKRYIDFAAAHGFGGVLVEGWNVGWEDWYGQWKEDVFDFVTPYPDFNVKEIQHYATSKGVQMIMHHETSASATNYDRRMDAAYKFMVDNGYPAVKTGYVGRIIPRGEHHDGQWMVNHYLRAAQKTAANKLMLNAHEPVRPTGLHRTFPNWLASEAARGNEFNAWSSGNAPDHETILPFTRLIGGPMDYTPGIFEVKMSHYDQLRNPPPSSPNTSQVHTTLVKQLALYITMYSPLQMAADLPQNYERYPDAFQFIKDVAVDWDDTRILEAEPGDYITISRKSKGKDEWFIGAITDENPRAAQTALLFLDPGKSYKATIYADGPGAHWKENPKAYVISSFLVTSKTILKLQLAAGGGAAVSLKPVTATDAKGLKKYK